MHLVNLNKYTSYFLISLFIIGFLVTRLPYLAQNEINPDAVNWHYRSQQFIVGLKTLDFMRTYQHYHPGVTLMWAMGIPVEFVKQISPVNQIINNENFLMFHFVSKLSLVIVQLVLSLAIIFFLSKILEFKKAFLIAILFSLEPFFVGNSRILHLDVLLTLFLFLGLICAYIYVENHKLLYGFLAGIFLSLSFLTKSVGILGFLYVLGIYGFLLFFGRRFNLKMTFKPLLVVMAGFVISLFLFFPAMWQKPVWVLEQIFTETERVGVRNGHGQVILGEYTRDGGPFFYPLVLLMKTSPFLLFGVLLWLLIGSKQSKDKFFIYLSLFYLGYILVMMFPSKKIDRYMIPVFPYLAVVSVYGYYGALNYFKNAKEAFITVAGILLALCVVAPLVTLYPYYFTYTSPIFGTATNANKLLAQKSFGVGVVALKDLIFEKYGQYPNIGFVDTKPMRAIYMNSRIFDIRESGTSKYNLLVLGVNDEYNDVLGEQDVILDDPNKVVINSVEYNKDLSMYINGLEFWKVYVKKIK